VGSAQICGGLSYVLGGNAVSPQCWLCAVCAVGHVGCCVEGGGGGGCGGRHIIIALSDAQPVRKLATAPYTFPTQTEYGSVSF